MNDEEANFSEAQIAFVLEQADDGTNVGEVCRKTGISEATFYAWRKKYAALLRTYLATDGEPGKLEADALLTEIERRKLNLKSGA